MSYLNKMFKYIILLLEILFFPIFIINLLISKIINKLGIFRLPIYRSIFFKFGLLYVNNHYYSPFFNALKKNNLEIDNVNYKIPQQIEILSKFDFVGDFKKHSQKNDYLINNDNFEYFDSEILYLLIRNFQPKKIIEIGGGFSTLISNKALNDNKKNYIHDCIEPFENSWLKNYKKINFIKKQVQDIDLEYFQTLNKGDLLLIDSSHMIKPNGDVLFEYTKIIPRLKKGVIVGIHDIFLPFDYPIEWRNKYVRFWNEQYLLKIIIQFSKEWEVLLSLNYLSYIRNDKLNKKFNFYDQKNPGSFYIKKK